MPPEQRLNDLHRQDHERVELVRTLLERIGYRIRELKVIENHHSAGPNFPRLELELEQLDRTIIAGALLNAGGELLAIPERWREAIFRDD